MITAVLKLEFHCQGCIEKIDKIVLKTKGIHVFKTFPSVEVAALISFLFSVGWLNNSVITIYFYRGAWEGIGQAEGIGDGQGYNGCEGFGRDFEVQA